MKILVVDDHPLVREGMKELFISEGYSVQTAAGGEDALEILKNDYSRSRTDSTVAPANIVITDIRMPGMDGFAFVEKTRKLFPEIKIIMLAGSPLQHELERARNLGAAGYLPKSMPWEDLVRTLRAVLAGAPFQEENFTEEKTGNLSPREFEILKYLAMGKTFEEVAIIFSIGKETVKSHVRNIRVKLDAPSAIAAVSRAYELGILRP